MSGNIFSDVSRELRLITLARVASAFRDLRNAAGTSAIPSFIGPLWRKMLFNVGERQRRYCARAKSLVLYKSTVTGDRFGVSRVIETLETIHWRDRHTFRPARISTFSMTLRYVGTIQNISPQLLHAVKSLWQLTNALGWAFRCNFLFLVYKY